MNQKTTNKKLLAIFAHPDDESIMMGGTLAYYARRGADVHLLCATRGEWGTICDESLAARENLGAVREKELQNACEILGVSLEGFLDCPDGDINNTDWSGIEEKIVRFIRSIRPQVVVTFGLDGFYGHPDHIAVSMLTSDAFTSAADENRFAHQFEEGLKPFQASKLYFAQYPDFLMRELFASVLANHDAAHLWGFNPETFGVPASEITTLVNVVETLPLKLKAIKAHETQFAPDNIFSLVNEETAGRFLSREYFRLVNRAIVPADLENDLFAGIIISNNGKN
ncbi:MAG TPA: PIG-L family deacetylase [Pyrinomonadaceae bacterium]|nr:PIG-L family deacetylase [Pyrinomonadaceae bacterium]